MSFASPPGILLQRVAGRDVALGAHALVVDPLVGGHAPGLLRPAAIELVVGARGVEHGQVAEGLGVHLVGDRLVGLVGVGAGHVLEDAAVDRLRGLVEARGADAHLLRPGDAALGGGDLGADLLGLRARRALELAVQALEVARLDPASLGAHALQLAGERLRARRACGRLGELAFEVGGVLVVVHGDAVGAYEVHVLGLLGGGRCGAGLQLAQLGEQLAPPHLLQREIAVLADGAHARLVAHVDDVALAELGIAALEPGLVNLADVLSVDVPVDLVDRRIEGPRARAGALALEQDLRLVVGVHLVHGATPLRLELGVRPAREALLRVHDLLGDAIRVGTRRVVGELPLELGDVALLLGLGLLHQVGEVVDEPLPALDAGVPLRVEGDLRGQNPRARRTRCRRARVRRRRRRAGCRSPGRTDRRGRSRVPRRPRR